MYLFVIVCYNKKKREAFFIMYIAITGSKNNKDVYIYRSFRKENGKASSCIYKKLRKYNALLEQFDGNEYKLMVWAKEQAAKETELYKQHTGKVSVEFSKAATFIQQTRYWKHYALCK